MYEKIVISQLKAKRAELAGEIQKAEKALAKLPSDLATIDGALRIFDPKINPRPIGPRQRRGPALLPHGAFSRAVPDVLRRASIPMTARQIATQIAVEKGLQSDHVSTDKFCSKVRTVCLNRKAELVKERGVDGALWRARWKLGTLHIEMFAYVLTAP